MEVVEECGIGRCWELARQRLDFSEERHQVGLRIGSGDGGHGFFQLDLFVEQTGMQSSHGRSVAVSGLNSSHLE